MKILLVLPLIFLSGCFHKQDTIVVDNYVFIPVVCEDFGKIEPVKRLPVKFEIGVDEEGNNLLGLRGQPYSNLSIIIRDTLRFIGEQDKAIDYYKSCIENHNSITLNEKGQPE